MRKIPFFSKDRVFAQALIAGLLISCFLSWETFVISRAVEKERFGKKSLLMTESLKTQLTAYERIGSSLAAFFAASDTVEPHEWERFINGLEVDELKGIGSINFIRKVAANELSAFAKNTGLKLHNSYLSSNTAHASHYCIVMYGMRLQDAAHKHGMDLCAQPQLQRYMESAETTLQSTINPVVIEENGATRGGDIFYPVLDKNGKFTGWINIELIYQDIFASILPTNQEIDFDVFISYAKSSEQHLLRHLYDSDKKLQLANFETESTIEEIVAEHYPDRILQLESFQFGQQNWQIAYTTSGKILWPPVIVFMAGAFISLILALLFHSMSNTGRRVQELANQITRSLKKSEEDLRETSLRLELAVAGSNDGLWDYNIINKTLYLSPRWKQQLGYTDKELPNDVSSWENNIHPDDAALCKKVFEDYVADKIPQFSVEYRLRHKDGSWRWILSRGQLAHDESGQPSRLVGFNTDITLQKEQNEQLNLAKEAAEQANKAKSLFLATMSHEIRTPMNGVIGMADLALGTDLTTEQRDYISALKSSATSLMTIINDILDYSKMEAGKLSLEIIPFDLNTTIEKVGRLLKTAAEEKNIEFKVDIDPSVPMRLKGDPTRLQQILFNLLGNAIKFTHNGKVTLNIGLLDHTEGAARIRFTIEDTGIGIAKESLATLFTRFNQTDNSITRKYGGTGLGLSICKQLVEMMNGRMGVDSVLQKGSTFWFELPFNLTDGRRKDPILGLSASIQNPLPIPIVAAMQQIEELPPITKKLHVLVAEDNRINQKVILALLSKLGHRLDVVDDGAKAVAAVQEKSYDLILMDIQMPGMDGLAATKKIRALPNGASKIPIIALTANAMQGVREDYIRAGMNDYVTKPINLPQLITVMNRIFQD